MATYPLEWDATGARTMEAGVKKGVFYPYNAATNKYTPGVAWNGLSKVSESPDGADAQDIYADNIKYATLRGMENHKGSIEAYTYPDEFMECDGSATIIPGVHFGQQKRKMFGMSYVTMVGSDVDPDMSSEKIHLVYGMTVSPSSRDYETINDNPDAITFSWDYETVPFDFPDNADYEGYKPTAIMTIDTSKFAKNSAAMTAVGTLKTKLYGSGSTAPELPLPTEVITMFKGKSTTAAT